MLGILVVAGLMLTVGVAPAIALSASNSGPFALSEDLKIAKLQQKTRIYAKKGGKDVLLASFYVQNRESIKWDDVPASVKNATLGAEDPRFFDHGGVDPMGIVSALVNNVVHGSNRGASTISQQYVKNVCIQEAELLPTQTQVDAAYAECTGGIQRKLKEARGAIALEKAYSKQEILLGYLNIAGFGGRIYGIQAAAKYYYGVDAKDLTIAQAASLMAIVNNPSYLRLDEKANLAANKIRRDYVLGVELKYELITEAEYDAAIQTPVKPKITPTTTGCAAAKSAAFFCDYVVNVVTNDPAFGKTRTERYNKLQSAGWKIYTTLDLGLQSKASAAMKANVPAQSAPGTNLGGAAVSVQAGTGRILSMVENKRYDNTQSKATTGADYTATSVNYNTDTAYGGSQGFQPGSTFKMFTLIDWLENGHGLNEVVQGSTARYPAGTFPCANPDGPWSPGNDTPGEGGYQTVMQGTAGSVNGVFASMAMKLKLCDIMKTSQDLGFHRANGEPLEANPPAILGSNINAASPLTMASAYATIANKGIFCSSVAIDKIVSSDGSKVTPPAADCHRVLPEDVSIAVGYALHGVLTGGTASIDRPALGGAWGFAKTGTTDFAHSTWVVGGSTKTVTAAWVGNVSGDANLRLIKGWSSYGNSAADARHGLWSGIMAANEAKYPGDTSWPQPASQFLYGQKIPVPDVSGKSVSQAKQILKAAGFQVKTGGSTPSDTIPAGSVVSTDPASGSSVVAGTLITLTKSSGQAPTQPTPAPGATATVPVVQGAPIAQAIQTLAGAGFTNVNVTWAPQGGALCLVMQQTPGGNTPADPNATTVQLSVAGDQNTCQAQQQPQPQQ
ncbi:membrane peptidoglycan carboxypeptidase [Amnibacterium kyonggiense]|uniref:Membrane peptidoglycan carboxypeptidase n=1 Tax=Amnibacterium kyonggiense TaxID=595671 RepID=A0A4R7FH85_9MICO|nr:membrane peptidoglycan carboxypeptidase [Amnibacterium kyonggiense]